jgi:cytoskeletal protein CcmA (bactofilin family)
MSDDEFDNEQLNSIEKVTQLHKNLLGFPHTGADVDWYLETNTTPNEYTFGENLLLEDVPDNPTWTEVWSKSSGTEVPSRFNLNKSNFQTGGKIEEASITKVKKTIDATYPFNPTIVSSNITYNVVRRYTRLILDSARNVARDVRSSYTKLDSLNNNVLQNGLQFNYKWAGVGFDKPYEYKMEIFNSGNSSFSGIFPNVAGGNWVYDVQHGVVLFNDIENNEHNIHHDTNKPIFTFCKYIGNKGINKLNDNDVLFKQNIDVSNVFVRNDLHCAGALYLNQLFVNKLRANDASFNNVDINGTLNVVGNTRISDTAGYPVRITNYNSRWNPNSTQPSTTLGSSVLGSLYFQKSIQMPFIFDPGTYGIGGSTGIFPVFTTNWIADALVPNSSNNIKILNLLKMSSDSTKDQIITALTDAAGLLPASEITGVDSFFGILPSLFPQSNIDDMLNDIAGMISQAISQYNTIDISNVGKMWVNIGPHDGVDRWLSITTDNALLRLQEYLVDMMRAVFYHTRDTLQDARIGINNATIIVHTGNIASINATLRLHDGRISGNTAAISSREMTGVAATLVGSLEYRVNIALFSTTVMTVGIVGFPAMAAAAAAAGIWPTALAAAAAAAAAMARANAAYNYAGDVNTALTTHKSAYNGFKIATNITLNSLQFQIYGKQDKINKDTNISLNDLTVYGNLTVNKINYETENITTTYKNSIINDNIITLGADISNNANSYDTGFIFVDNSNNKLNKTIFWSQSENKFIFGKTDSSGVAISDATMNVNLIEKVNIAIKDITANNATFNDATFNDATFNNVNINGKLTLRGDISANDASFNNTNVNGNLNVKGDISANDASFNNVDISGALHVKGDISANDASFNNVDISGALHVKGDISGNDASFNNVDVSGSLHVKGDISANDASFNNVDISGALHVKGDISANDASFNNVDVSGSLHVKGDISANDASFNNVDVSGSLHVKGDISANDASFNNVDISGILNVKDPSGFPIKITNKDPSGNIAKKGEAQFDISTNILYVNVDGSNNWQSIQGGGGGGAIDISGNINDLSKNFIENSDNTFNNEGNIIYDTSENLFYEASRSKSDKIDNYSNLKFRELGYSFFRQNWEGQPPPLCVSCDVEVDLCSIKITWKNPKQYSCGLTNKYESYLSDTSSTINANGNVLLPVANRMMMQIKNLDTGIYEYWGNISSNISNIQDLSSGRIICSKNHPIPPHASTGILPLDNNRTLQFSNSSAFSSRIKSIYKLEDFPTSITLFLENFTPTDASLNEILNNNSKMILPTNATKNNTELSPSRFEEGYEIKLWLENEYIKTDINGGNIMTENDFNVFDLKDCSGNYVNFEKVDPPSIPFRNDASIIFSDNIVNSKDNLSAANTIIVLKTNDPLYSHDPSNNVDYNSKLLFTAIKFEFANYNDNEILNWLPCKKIIEEKRRTSFPRNWAQLRGDLTKYSDITLDVSGVWNSSSASSPATDSIPRVNDNITNVTPISPVVNRYYYIKLNNEFLGITNGQFKQNIKFRLSYKNGSQKYPEEFGEAKESEAIIISYPSSPNIESVKMSSYNEIKVVLSGYSSLVKILDPSSNQTLANPAAFGSPNIGSVFLKDISFNITAQYEDDNNERQIIDIVGLKGWSDDSILTTNETLLVSSRNNQNTTYIFELPSGYLDSTKITDLSYNFSLQVKNNINKNWSNVSNVSSLQITEPDISNKTIAFTASDTSNNVLDVTWGYPDLGKRGIISKNIELSGGSVKPLPVINKFSLESSNLEIINIDGAISKGNEHVIAQRDRDDDALNASLSFYSAVEGRTGIVTFDLSVNAYNEYINDFSSIFGTIDISVTAPSEVQDLSAVFVISNTSNVPNSLDLSWSHPANLGLQINGEAIRNTIIRYDISGAIIAKNKYHSVASSVTGLVDKITKTNTISNNTLHQTIINHASNQITISNTSGETFIFPATRYKIGVRATNSLNFTGPWIYITPPQTQAAQQPILPNTK